MAEQSMSSATSAAVAKSIPGPRGLEKWKIIPGMLSRPHETLLELALKYGPIAELEFPTERAVIVSNAEYLEHLFHHNHKNYDKQTHRWDTFRQLWGNGLLTADGDLWRRQRQRIQPAFHQECMQNFATIVVDESRKMVNQWRAAAAAGEARDVYPDMLQVAVRTVTRAMFGADIESKGETVIRAVADTHDYVNPVSISSLFSVPLAVRRLTVPGFRRFHDALRTINQVFDEIIQERIKSGASRPDLLGMMMAARDDERSEVMSVEQLHDEMITTLMAGHETTGIATSWTWYWLSQYPDVQRELQREVATVVGDRPPAFEDLPHLQLTRMVFQESMRLTPPIWAIERKARDEDRLDGYRIRAGTTLIMSPYVMHHHPDYWQAPSKFDPQRFRPEEEKRRPQYAYFPFGGGPRRCVGLRVGMLEGQLMLATFAQAFTVRLKPGHPVVPGPRLNMPPKFGLPMFFDPNPAGRASVA